MDSTHMDGMTELKSSGPTQRHNTPLRMAGVKALMDSTDGKTKLLQICRKAFEPSKSKQNKT